MSACLAKIRCRYDNKILKLTLNQQKTIDKLLKNKNVILICPEQLGGLPTPRPPAKIIKGKVINEKGVDVTKNFNAGAQAVCQIVKLFKIRTAYLKNRSPSCGKKGVATKSLKNLNVSIHFI